MPSKVSSRSILGAACLRAPSLANLQTVCVLDFNPYTATNGFEECSLSTTITSTDKNNRLVGATANPSQDSDTFL
jgi:hypothetical protein